MEYSGNGTSEKNGKRRRSQRNARTKKSDRETMLERERVEGKGEYISGRSSEKLSCK